MESGYNRDSRALASRSVLIPVKKIFLCIYTTSIPGLFPKGKNPGIEVGKYITRFSVANFVISSCENSILKVTDRFIVLPCSRPGPYR